MDLASRPSPVSKRSESRSNLRDPERDSLRKLGDNRWRSTIIFMASLRAERKLHGLWPWKEESRRNKGPHQGSFVSGFFFLVFSPTFSPVSGLVSKEHSRWRFLWTLDDPDTGEKVTRSRAVSRSGSLMGFYTVWRPGPSKDHILTRLRRPWKVETQDPDKSLRDAQRSLHFYNLWAELFFLVLAQRL